MKIGDKVRVRLECIGIDEYRNLAGVVTHIVSGSKQCIFVEFDNENIVSDIPFYEQELEVTA